MFLLIKMVMFIGVTITNGKKIVMENGHRLNLLWLKKR